MGPKHREGPGMACSACYYLVISSTHLSNGHFRRVKGVFRGPLCPTASSDSPERAERALGCSVEDLKALFYCELCDKQYLRHQEFDNHINSYDHAHKQRLKELKHREFARNVASKSWKDQRKQEKALRRLHQLAQLQQEAQRVPGTSCGLRSTVRAVNQQQDRDVEQRHHSPDDKPRPVSCSQRPRPAQTKMAALSRQTDPIADGQSPCKTLAQSPLIAHPPSSTDPPAASTQSCLDLHPQLPLPGRGRAGGRLGVSFCFSRRGPRLEPSASVFSDLEEEEREKREQIKERIRGIMEDIDREIGAAEERKHRESEKRNRVEPNDVAPTPREAAREEEEIEKSVITKEKEHSLISTAAADNQSHDSLFSPSQTQVTVWGAGLSGSHVDVEHTDIDAERKAETEVEVEESQHVCVLGKDGSTRLRWPPGLLKFTKCQPHISYSCNPRRQEESLSDESNSCVPVILTPDAHSSCLQRETRHELRQKIAEENFKTEQHIDVETKAHLPLKKHLSSSETGTGRESCRHSSVEKCVRAESHPSDPPHCDSADTNSQNPLGGRLGGARGIRDRAITALSCKLESVTQSGTQGMCISPSRCDCGSETMCECGSAPAPPPSPPLYVGVSEVSRKKTKGGTKKHKLGKRKRSEKEKTSNEHQSVRCKVRSVVSTVSTCRERKEQEEEGGSWGSKRRQKESEETRMTGRRKRRRRRRVRRAGSSCLLGRSEAESVSVSVRRKRRPHRSLGDEDGEEAELRGIESQLSSHTEDEGRRYRHRDTDGDPDTFPWRSHSSLHSSFFSPGCNSTPFWEQGHHSNPRSFIDCCYPDNSCGDGSSPARKRELSHWDRKFIHSKRKSLRHRGVCFRDGGLISDTEQWDWMRGHCPGGGDDSRTRWRWRNGARAEIERFSSSPSSWGRRSGHLSTEDVDWDRCSVDRWTWGSSSDSWEDRRTHRSTSGSRTGGDNRDSPGRGWRCTGARRSSSRRFSSPDDWWTSGRTYSPRVGGGHSPRSCSPCSSTSLSELSWGWSRSSTCSGVTDGVTVTSGRTSAPREAQKQNDSTSTPSSPVRSAPQPPPLSSQSDLRPGSTAPVNTSSSGTNPPGLNSDKKPAARTLLLPLIGKLPAIQRKARRKKWLLEKSQEKEEEEEEVGQKDLCSSQIRTEDKQRRDGETTTTAPISFTAEEMDKYRLLQEQAREHMQKVLEQTKESVDSQPETNYSCNVQTESCGTSEEQFTPGPGPGPGPGPCPGALQAPPPPPLPPHVTSHDSFTQPLALRLPRLPPLPPSPPLSSLHHIILQHTGLSMPPPSSPTTSSSSSSPPPPSIHPHPLPPPLPHHLHLSPFSISSLFPSILLSHHHHHHHHPVPLLPPQPFHASPLAPLSTVALQPLTPQPFMDRVWPVRFQQKAL